jgi:hypothetical protein
MAVLRFPLPRDERGCAPRPQRVEAQERDRHVRRAKACSAKWLRTDGIHW